MKSRALRYSKGLLLALTCSLAVVAAAQPTWRFHLAFEDGTGARDTIWFVFDTTATVGESFGQVDLHLGEGAVHMNQDEFNVWLENSSYDSTKTIAFPYSMFPHITAYIHAFNYTFPMIWRWDTALFRLPWLPAPGFPYDGGKMDNDFFFAYNNDPWNHSFIMGWDDSVVVQPTHPNMGVFPVTVNLGIGSTTGMQIISTRGELTAMPNPGKERLTLRDEQVIEQVEVRALDGRLCKVQQGNGRSMELALPELPSGIYLLRIRRADGTWLQERWVKAAQ